MNAPEPARDISWNDPRSHLIVGPTGSGKSASSHVLAAVAEMQRNPSMPTVFCRFTEHGPLTGVGSDASGTPLLRCVRCGATDSVTEDQVRLALGAAALPPAEPTGVFGAPITATEPVLLQRAPLRIDTAFGSVRVVTAFALLVAVLAALRLASMIGAGWALIVATMLAVALDVAGSRLSRYRNRGRAAWLPGHDMTVIDLNPGTWIETPLNLRATTTTAGVYTPRRAAQVRSITGLPDSPQTGYLALTLSDGRRYTVAGAAPIRTLHLDQQEIPR